MKIKIIFVCLMLVFLAGCGKQEDTNSESTNEILYNESFLVGGLALSPQQFYGTVVAKNVIGLSTSVAGSVTELNCQPGQQVAAGQLLARIIPAIAETSTQNSQIQASSLQSQLTNLSQIGQATSSSFESQRANLITQRDSLSQQVAFQQKNLDNLLQQQSLTTGDLLLQRENLSNQLDSLKISREKDIEKIDSSLLSLSQQAQNLVKPFMDSVNKNFGVTTKEYNANYDIYIAGKNSAIRQQVESKYYELDGNKIDQLLTATGDSLSDLIESYAQFSQLAADAINLSIASSRFTQDQIDALYASFTATSNQLVSMKANLQATIIQRDAVENSYKNQISTATLNLQNLDDNKILATTLNLDSQINQAQSQLSTIKTNLSSIEEQLRNIDNTKNIQLNQLYNQSLSLQQNLDSLKNSLNGENIVAPKSGVIKSVKVQVGNKLQPGTLVCEIATSNDNQSVLQLFSAQKIATGTTVSFYRDGQFVVSGEVNFELPYRDPTTQSYIYEIPTNGTDLIEGEKLVARFDIEVGGSGEMRIPLQYITPRLDGYFVERLFESKVEEIAVEVGPINGQSIKILSGLSLGDTIVK